MSQSVLHQVTVGATLGDAITDHALLLRRWLRERGLVSNIYAHSYHPALEGEVLPFSTYRPQRAERFVIYHHSTGSSVAERLMTLPVELMMVYHNITPPEFFASVNPALAEEMQEGRRQLYRLRERTLLALGVSPFNELDLKHAGYLRTGVLPLALDESQYQLPNDSDLVARFKEQGPLLLFVGRLVPNKKYEDLLKLLYYYRRIDPKAQLLLVGGQWVSEYERWLKDLAHDLGLGGAVHFTGHVTQQQMVTYYRLADLYVSMSEHEGFGKPLIESMYLDLPVLAYAAAGVPYTLREAGVQVHRKEFEAIAELVDLLVTDLPLRERILAGQRQRVQAFLETQVREQLYEYLTLVSHAEHVALRLP
ncbi:MAG: glycosyltransferase [Chloroflexota bacterium]|nr:glycosyltransferase [Chloroflexota bacterium]